MTSRLVAAAAAVAVTLLAAGCSSTVAGVAEPGADAASAATVGGERVSATLESMLLTPEDFPAPYQALVLTGPAIEQAAPDLDGIPAGAKVDPAGCKPPAQAFGPDATAMIVGTDNAARTTISVELTRVDAPLSSREDEIRQCPNVATTKDGVTATVSTTVLPAPPLNADGTMALRQTVTSGGDDAQVRQSMLRLVGQVGDVRISATHMTFGAGKPDSATLDQVFTEAVGRVNAAAN